MNEENKLVAREFLRCLGAGDVSALQALMTRDAVAITAGYSAISGPRDYDAIIALATALPQITKSGVVFEIRNVTAEDDGA